MVVWLRTEDSQDIIVLVDWFAEVSSLLLVPPAAVGVSELTFHRRGVLVVAILCMMQAVSIVLSRTLAQMIKR